MMADDLALWSASGIYVITCTVTGDQYVGQTKTFVARLGMHVGQLNGNRHPIAALQAAWNEHGPHSFTYEILEVIVGSSTLLEREQHWIESLSPRYNTMPSHTYRPPRAFDERFSAARAEDIKRQARNRSKFAIAMHAKRKTELKSERRKRIEAAAFAILDERHARGYSLDEVVADADAHPWQLAGEIQTRGQFNLRPSAGTARRQINPWYASRSHRRTEPAVVNDVVDVPVAEPERYLEGALP